MSAGSSERAVAEAAFFDLDKTIIARASMSVFRGPLYTGGLLSRRAAARAVFAQLVTLHLGAREPALTRLRNALLRLASGWSQENVREIVEEALERLVDPIIYDEALELIAAHQREGRAVVIVSASPEEIVVPLGRHLGVTATISSRAAIDEAGRYTGELEFYAYGQQKAEALRDWAASHEVDLLSSFAYSDSFSDMAMLELVGHPVVVNADRALRELAHERGWEVRSFTRPVRLRDRVRAHVTRRALSSVASVGAGALVAAASWVLMRRRARPALVREALHLWLLALVGLPALRP